MNHIFEINDKTGKKIRLTKEQWRHISIEHPDVKYDEIKLTLQTPTKIINKGRDGYFYYRYFKHKNSSFNFLKTIVKYLNGGGICNIILFC